MRLSDSVPRRLLRPEQQAEEGERECGGQPEAEAEQPEPLPKARRALARARERPGPGRAPRHRPERMAHKSQKLQFEVVAVLGLLALFTHVHLFWIAGLFLAMIDIPDFGTPLRSIAQSVEKIAGGTPDVLVAEKPVEVEDRSAALAVEKPETRVSKAKVHGHA